MAVDRTWHPAAGRINDRAAAVKEIVRLATLAPSSDNTQCWRFAATATGLVISPDWTRRCPAVDPDDHHLFVSLGCAVENLAHASLAHGLKASARFDAARGLVHVDLETTSASRSALFAEITERQCTRAPFDGAALTIDEPRQLADAGTRDGIRILLLTDRPPVERVVACVVEANTVQMRDPAFERELKSWIRFDDAEAVRTADGRRRARPAIRPSRAGSRVRCSTCATGRRTKRTSTPPRSAVRQESRSSFSTSVTRLRGSKRDAPRTLRGQATSMGIRNAFINQPVEVAALRPRFADAFDLGSHRSELVARFGRGPRLPRSLRRPLDAVLA